MHHDLAFDRRGRSQGVDVTHLANAQLIARGHTGGTLALETGANDAWHVVAVAQLCAGLTTLRIPEEARAIRARLLDNVRRPPIATLVGRIEDL